MQFRFQWPIGSEAFFEGLISTGRDEGLAFPNYDMGKDISVVDIPENTKETRLKQYHVKMLESICEQAKN